MNQNKGQDKERPSFGFREGRICCGEYQHRNPRRRENFSLMQAILGRSSRDDIYFINKEMLN